MDEWKGEIKFSKEFQKHIWKVIQRKEKLKESLGGDQQLQSIIERLQEEKMETIGDYKEIGCKDGVQWAEEAHYEQIQAVLSWNPDEGFPQNDCLDELKEYFTNAIMEDEHMDWQDWQHDRPNKYNDQWLNGWKEGVETFWNKVKDKL